MNNNNYSQNDGCVTVKRSTRNNRAFPWSSCGYNQVNLDSDEQNRICRTEKTGKEQKAKTDRWVLTAYHEAAHAVLCYEQKIQIIETQSELNLFDDRAYCSFRPQPSGNDFIDTWCEIIVGLSGFIAEEKLLGRQYSKEELLMEAGFDLFSVFKKLKPWEEKKLLPVAIDSTRSYLDDDLTWKRVEAVAKELLVKKSLSGKEVHRICLEMGQGVLHLFPSN
jgi:hypothetical protein